jgi:hypothetical protein
LSEVNKDIRATNEALQIELTNEKEKVASLEELVAKKG